MNFEVVKPMRGLVRLARFLDQSNPLGEIRWFKSRNPKNEKIEEIEKSINPKKTPNWGYAGIIHNSLHNINPEIIIYVILKSI